MIDTTKEANSSMPERDLRRKLWIACFFVAAVPLPIVAGLLIGTATKPDPTIAVQYGPPLVAEPSTTTKAPPAASAAEAPGLVPEVAPAAVVSRPAARPAPAAKQPVLRVTTTSTTTAAPPAKPRTLLEIAQGEVGKAGPYASDSTWCGQFVGWIAQQAGVSFELQDSPARLHTNAKADGRLSATPIVGGLVFIDLLGENNPHDYVTHVGIVEAIDGDQIKTIEGNALPDASVVTRHTRTLGDGFVIDFASFDGSGQ